MTVKELREQLAGMPDGALVVLPGRDHSYREAIGPHETTAGAGHYDRDRKTGRARYSHLSEWWGEATADEAETPIAVVVLS